MWLLPFVVSVRILWIYSMEFTKIFTIEDTTPLFRILYPTVSAHIIGPVWLANVDNYARGMNVYGIDAMFIPYASGTLIFWLTSTISIIKNFTKEYPLFYQGTLFIPSKFILL